MTDRHPGILTVRDAEILRRLRRVVDAGEYYNSFTAHDVVHVATHWLVPGQARVVPLRVVEAVPEVVPEPELVPDDDARIVTLPPRQAAVLAELCKGGKNRAIGEALGITEDCVKTHMRRVYDAIGTRSRTEATALVLGGKVRIVVKGSNRKKAS